MKELLLKNMENLLADGADDKTSEAQFALFKEIRKQQFKLAENYLQGKNGKTQNVQAAYDWFVESARMGYAPAQHMVAEFKKKVEDYEQMIYWYTLSAEQDTEGEESYSLARLHRNGVLVPQDHAMALKWFKRVLEISPKDATEGVVPKILFTFDMEDTQSPPVQDGHIYSCNSGLPFSYISLGLHSRAMRKFEAENPATDEQIKWLAFGAMLPTRNFESSRTLAFLESEAEVKKGLRESWGIHSAADAHKTASYLCAAEGHTPIADEIYKNVILNSQHFFSNEHACEHLKNNTLPTVFKKYFLDIHDLGVDGDLLPTENIINAIAEIHANSGAFSEYSSAAEAMKNIAEFEENVEVHKAEYMKGMYSYIVNEMHKRISPYSKASVWLTAELGYDSDGLRQIPTLAAWDYGRVAYIVRTSVKAGYMSEESAWTFLQKAAEAAAATYSSWREYLAAYILGRALGYKNNSADWFQHTFRYLLEDSQSPFNMVEIEWGGKSNV